MLSILAALPYKSEETFNHAALTSPEWWLVIAAYLTLGFLFWQTWEVRKSADAALLNARALANSERARMSIVGESMGHSVEFSAKNVGRVPAGITYAHGFVVKLPFGEKLPIEPGYLHQTLDSEVQDWIAPGETIDLPTDQWPRLLADLSDETIRKNIEENRETLWIYARICYRDGISDEIKETRFCHSVSIGPDGYPQFRRDGSLAYRFES